MLAVVFGKPLRWGGALRCLSSCSIVGLKAWLSSSSAGPTRAAGVSECACSVCCAEPARTCACMYLTLSFLLFRVPLTFSPVSSACVRSWFPSFTAAVLCSWWWFRPLCLPVCLPAPPAVECDVMQVNFEATANGHPKGANPLNNSDTKVGMGVLVFCSVGDPRGSTSSFSEPFKS